MVKPIQLSVIAATFFLLSACSKSILDNDDARCPFTDRGGCQSMEMVNRMVTLKRFTPDGQFVQQAPMLPNNAPHYAPTK